MKTITRRKFLNSSMTAGLALGMPRIVLGAEGSSRSPSPNDTVRVAVLGLGSTTAVGGVGGRGHQLIPRAREVPGARIVALCDVDQTHLDREAQPFKDRNEEVATYRDLRRVLDDKTIDAVLIALPNHGHALVYRARDGIGTVNTPTSLPGTVDYDLWCGPAPKSPLMRKQLHYEWHWFWATGNGEMGNNGIHVIDISRWALGQNQPPPRAMSIGGRFAFNDCGETANTHIALFDYQPAPLICEVRNVRASKGPEAMGKFRNQNHGLVIDCEGGYFAGDASGGVLFDTHGKKIKDFPDEGGSKGLETSHLSNFLTAVRSRKAGDLAAEALQGHHSTACCHIANVSYRLGKQARPEVIRETIQANRELSDAFERCREYLRENEVSLDTTPAVLGPWVTFDPKQERFVNEQADQANALSQREYRQPFVVPKLA